MSDLTARRAVVTGRVQGVGYRYATRDLAERLSVTGWVRNLPSGQVEVFVQGPPAAVDAMIAWLERGPRWASVTGVEAAPAESNPGLATFEVRF